jgi:DNA-binding response OmpR family regulator
LKKTSDRISYGCLEIEVGAHRVFLQKNGELTEIDLTRTEFKILLVLAQKPGQVFSREILLEKVWGANNHVADRVIMKKNLESKVIQAEKAL